MSIIQLLILFEIVAVLILFLGGYLTIDSKEVKAKGFVRMNAPDRAEKDIGTPLCVKFKYHMYGAGIGSIRVEEVTPEGRGIAWEEQKKGGT